MTVDKSEDTPDPASRVNSAAGRAASSSLARARRVGPKPSPTPGVDVVSAAVPEVAEDAADVDDAGDEDTDAVAQETRPRPKAEPARNGRTISITLPTFRRSGGAVAERTGPSRTTTVVVSVVSLLVVVALVVLALVVRSKADKYSAVDSARRASLAAAQVLVPKVISYDYRTFDADVRAGQAATTGRFRSTLVTLDKTIKSAVVTKQVIKTAKVTAASVTSASASSVEILMFVTQTNTVGSAKSAEVPARLEIGMTRSGGTWLVSDIKPV